MPELADPTRQCVHMRFTEMPTVRLGWFILWNLRRVIYRRPHKRGLEQNCLPLAFTMAITPAATPAHSAEAINCCAPLPAERTTNRKNTSINVLVLPNKNARSSSYDSTETEGINSPGRKKILELFTKKKKKPNARCVVIFNELQGTSHNCPKQRQVYLVEETRLSP